ncbi:phage integrase SAM-like domain-containing protein [Polaribacter sp. BAL334]|uniref:phage integrase SAM-like domain-containing protein n=1 Tax=Polaribacter sp. BAL334 TaxID=1708178 RepID=UPI0018D20CED|nr:phage integrase SAM-like domain-containing protein [Polaribacter sp. BAL334]MBG7612099.1 phage integrase SAM-like domain-containing protein [Polaribacter sp. BAL334]
MASIIFRVKGKTKPSPIHIRFTHGRNIDFWRSTSLQINPEYWGNGKVKNLSKNSEKINLQNKLNELEKTIIDSFNEVFYKGGIINAEWLEKVIKKTLNQDTNNDFNYFVDYANYFYETLGNKLLKNGKTGASENSKKRYKTIINKIKEFETYKKKKLQLIDVNLKFHTDFIYFLHNVQKLNYNTTGKYLMLVKTICLGAKKYGIKINPEIENPDFKPVKEKVSFITLSETEINKIHETNFDKTPYLQNAKNWLIIGVWTGARVSDLLNFTKVNIKNGFIEYTAQKTNQKIILPLHQQVREILESNDGEFPHKISSQKFNDYIKTVCEQVGINEEVEGSKSIEVKKGVWRKIKGTYKKFDLVSTHICRRSFATNHYGRTPTPVLMAVTGHTTEKMFLNYIGKISKDNAEVLKKYWQDQELKKEQKPKLEIIKNGTN